jgi:hypothetical protein
MELKANTTENLLLTRAIEKFAAMTGMHIRVVAHQYPIGPGRRLHALVEIGAATHAKPYAIDVKHRLTNAKLGLATEQLRDAPYKGMLVTDYVNPKMADRLKEMDLAFIDLAGNAYLNEPPIFIYVKGNRLAEREFGRNLKPTRAFQATGLKVVFGLLTVPNLIHGTYRDIADATDVALGTVGWVLTDLKEHGFLYEGKGRARKLTQKRRIIEHWVTAYPEKLRPKLRMGKYRAPEQGWWRETDLEAHDAQWGGEVAAAKLTDYLKPDTAVIYADVVPPRLLAKNHLRTEPDGDLEILKRFWKTDFNNLNPAQTNVPCDVVAPLLVYADLMATTDDRNVETAKMIYDRYLDGYLRQD